MKLFRSQIPLYYQIEQILREKISSGTIAGKQPLPTETELCKEYGVSRTTIRQAFASLINDGLVYRIPGKGTFLSHNRSGGIGALQSFSTIEELVELVKKAKTLIHYHGLTSASKRVVSLMDFRAHKEIYCMRGVRILNNLPLCYFVINVPSRFASFFDGKNVESDAIISILEDKSGMVVYRMQQTISARVAGKRIARFLGIRETDPVLEFERVYYTVNNEVLEVAISWFHFKRYHYIMEFKHKIMRSNGKDIL